MGASGGLSGGFGGELPHPYAAAMGPPHSLQSPVVNVRNHLFVSPQQMQQHIMSPQNMLGSPRMMMPTSQLSPEFHQMQTRQLNLGDNHMNRFDHNILPSPNVHRQFDQSGLMLNQGIGGDSLNNRAMMQRQAKQDFQNFEALQSRLASIYPVDQFEPTPIDSFPDQANSLASGFQDRVIPNAASGGYNPNNPRRKPPPSLKRDDSLKMEKIFQDDGSSLTPISVKKKVDGNGSSAHLSAMSLSIGDMADEGNLSSVFDSSLRISVNEDKSQQSQPSHHQRLAKRKTDTSVASSSTWDGNTFDMSVNTMGEKFAEQATNFEPANMSFATFGDKMHESESDISYGRVFGDPDKAL